MLCLDTSLKAIHNEEGDDAFCAKNVYAMFRYKFESNSQQRQQTMTLEGECVCYV